MARLLELFEQLEAERRRRDRHGPAFYRLGRIFIHQFGLVSLLHVVSVYLSRTALEDVNMPTTFDLDKNPYATFQYAAASDKPGRWLRGNLHCHDSHNAHELGVIYEACLHDFLALTQHSPNPYPGAYEITEIEKSRLIGLRGLEIQVKRTKKCATQSQHFMQLHYVHVHPQSEFAIAEYELLSPDISLPSSITPQDVANKIGDSLMIVVHPALDCYQITPSELTQMLERGVCGLEIFCGFVDGHNPFGKLVETNLWDAVLCQSIQVWGFAGDDFIKDATTHGTTPGSAFNIVWVAENDLNRDTIVANLRIGCCFASTGIHIRFENMSDDLVEFTIPSTLPQNTPNYCRAIENNGTNRTHRDVPKNAADNGFVYKLDRKSDAKYVRFEFYDREVLDPFTLPVKATTAWSQAFPTTKW